MQKVVISIMKTLLKIVSIILLLFIICFFVVLSNAIYYMYYYKETVALIANINMENKFTLFLPVDRYAVTLVSTEQYFQTEKSISGKILVNGQHLSTFNVYESDINIGPVTESNISDRRPNKLYPETHNVPGYFYLKQIGVFNIEDHKYCTLEIIFDSVPENVLLKIETYMRK